MSARRDRVVVVLAARGEEAFDDIARRCEEIGGRALVVPTDVTRISEVERLTVFDAIDGARIVVPIFRPQQLRRWYRRAAARRIEAPAR